MKKISLIHFAATGPFRVPRQESLYKTIVQQRREIIGKWLGEIAGMSLE
jgi:hypothetical protein